MKTILILVALGVACVRTALPQERKREAREQPDLTAYAKTTRAELVDSLTRLSQERSDLESTLVVALDGEQPAHLRIAAAYLLGRYRMEGGTTALARVIALRDEIAATEINNRRSLWGEYPAADALAKIGRASVSPVLHNLAHSDDAKVRELSASVLRVVLGADGARSAILNAIADALPDQASASRLKAALPLVLEKR